MAQLASLDWQTALVLCGLGTVVGTVAPTFGIGGGLITVPALIFLFPETFDANTATATSLGLIVILSISGTLANVRQRRVDLRLAVLFAAFAIPGSFAGSAIAGALAHRTGRLDLLQALFGVVMFAIAVKSILGAVRSAGTTENAAENEGDRPVVDTDRVAWRRDFTDRDGYRFAYVVKPFPGVLMALFGGAVGALFGLGGGVIYVPILTLILGVPTPIATATSMFTIMLANPVAAVLRAGDANWSVVFFLAIGTVVAINVAPRFVRRVRNETIVIGFYVIVMIAATRLFVAVL